MDFVLFLAFSILETCSMFYMLFRIFKIDLYPKEFIFVGFILGFFSYVLRHDYNLVLVDIAFQYILTFCFLWLLFRIHIFYSTIMTGMAYQAYFLIQSLYYLILNLSNFYSLNSFYTISTYILQTVSAITAFLIGRYISKKRKGFDFIPDKPNGKIPIMTREKILFALSLPSILLFPLIYSFATNHLDYFILLPISYGFLLYVYIYFSYKKDRGDNEQFS
ncbi:hypothetical protein PUR_34830 [Paenibacillus sp. URB8-2]|nr:hypothetical protein PUR_34830 [Paenibacillus sp. URB8-2]